MQGMVLTVRAAADGQAGNRARVQGVAYTGGKMRLGGWDKPVVIDLAGMMIPSQVPLLVNHTNETTSRMGVVVCRVDGSRLTVDGEILSSAGTAQGIIEQARSGADWQMSVGADATNVELVKGSRMVNGMMQSGPFYHVKNSVLREVSVIPVGADMHTSMTVAAGWVLGGGGAMTFEKWLEAKGMDVSKLEDAKKAELKAEYDAEQSRGEGQGDGAGVQAGAGEGSEAEKAIRAERARVREIRSICAGEFAEIQSQAELEGWTPEETRAKVLKAVRESRPRASSFTVISRDSGRTGGARTLEAALCMRAGVSEESLVKSYGEQVMEAARRDAGMSLQQLFVECAAMEGVSTPRAFSNDTIRAGFSTVSLPGILNNVANKRMLRSFEAQSPVAQRLCSEGDLNDFKESERYRLTDVGDLQPVAPDGELKIGGLKEEKATNQLGTFGKLFSLTRQMIYNDDLGAFMKIPDAMGARAARKVDQLFFARLMSNPSSLFSVAHKNYAEGAGTALGKDALDAAWQLFLNQTDADGQPINVEPKFLLVPTALKLGAIELVNATLAIAVSGGKVVQTYNAVSDLNLEVISASYLANSAYTGYSSKAWYLFGDPAVVDTFEIGYLRGKRTPTIERGETDFDTLGIKFRVYFDVGVREQDHRGMVKMKGEA